MFKKLLITYFSLYLAFSPVVNATIQTQTTNTQSTNPTIVTQTPLPITLPTGTTGLFVQSQNPQTDYLIETNPEFTLYNNFISSDYLLKHINFNPDKTLKRIGDGFYEQKLIKEQLLQQTGRRFLTKDITSDNAQYQQLMDNAITQQKDLELSPGISLTPEQIAQLTQDIVWMEPQTITLANGTTTQALIPRVYIANTHQYQVEGSKIIAGKDISLTVNQLKNTGLVKAGDNLSVSALDNILNQGGTLQAGNTLTLLANNDISNISANIQAKDITLTSINGNINNIRFEKNVDYSQGSTKDTKKLIGEQSNIIANNITLTTNKNINLAGSNLNADNKLDLNANNVVLTTTQQVGDFYSGNSKNYLKENATTNLKSQIKATDINISANEQVIIKGANLQADNQINIQSKALNIASVKDTTNTQLHSESKGGLFGGGHNDTTTTSTTDNIQSTLQAKDLIITNKITQVQASKLKADTIKITTDLLNLVSDKDLDFKQIQTESSGFLTKTITDKGHNKQTKVIAVIKAKDKLSINNQQLTNNQLTNKRLTNNQLANTQLTPTQIQQLKQLSSADALNTQLSQQLKAQGITLSDVNISNKNWDESTTTLSGLGAIIVQVAATALTGGTANGFINAAMASVKTQLAAAVLTAGITGNSLAIDPKAMLKTALTAGASQYTLDQYGAKTLNAKGVETTSYNPNVDFNTNLQNGLQNTAITTAVSTAINGGSLADNLKTNLASSVLTTGLAKGANLIGDNKVNLGEIGHKAAHAALGCAGAKIQGKDCGSGAVGAVVGEVIAEQVGKYQGKDISKMTKAEFDQYKKDTTALARVGTAVIAQGLGKDVGTADQAASNAVENNFIIHVPGTFSSKKDVEKSFTDKLKDFFNDDKLEVIALGKNGEQNLENNKPSREQLAEKVTNKIIQELKNNPNEPIYLSGHSHGGNVQKLVTNKLVNQGYAQVIDGGLFLSTPNRDDYKINFDAYKPKARIINASDRSDIIQRLGGIDNIGLTEKDRKNFPAKQTIDNNPKVINVEIEVSNKVGIGHFVSPVISLIKDAVYGDHVDTNSKQALDKIQTKLNE
ncbi:DUF637 domain-containing protein [Candidatus Thiodubiliella endoseptemdiera]|uniref:DUF637 domain-containing protein n=1 Tax=Candidatus Thiodubiliella endoseptemdiera TaxID=2738886 RepID=UPI0034E04C10